MKFSALVGTTIKSTETSNWDKTQTECMHFNPYFSFTVYPAKVGVKMHAPSLHFISAAGFSAFIAVSTNTKHFKSFVTLFCELFLASYVVVYLCMHKRKHAAFICTGRIMAWLWYGGLTTVYKIQFITVCISLITNCQWIN